MTHDWLAELASRYNAQLRSYLNRFTSSSADIDDWIQESLLRVFAASKTSKLDDPAAYLFRTARNVALKRLSHRKVKHLAIPRMEQITATRLQSRPLHQMLQNSKDLARLSAALALLPERCREVFMMCKLDGYSYSEVAAQLGISTSTVEKHMIKALRQCRLALQPSATPEEQQTSSWHGDGAAGQAS